MRYLAMIVAVCFGLFVLVAESGPAIAQTSAAAANSVPACPVTHPNGHAAYGMTPGPNVYGNYALSTGLWPNGKVLIDPAHVQPNGTLAMKFWWQRGWGVIGKLIVTGHRLDAQAPPLRAYIPAGYGDKGFQATSLIFPTEGCWQVTGKVGKTSLTFVTLVVKVPRWPWPGPTPAATSGAAVGVPSCAGDADSAALIGRTFAAPPGGFPDYLRPLQSSMFT